MTKNNAMVVGIVASVVFCVLCGVNLAGQGLYYDEIHQAPAAFTWLGKEPIAFSRAVVGGLPLLNMPYSGALKSHAYGCYLRFIGDGHFSVISWRCLGIGFVACGIFLFCSVGGSRLGRRGLLLFLALLLTDTTVLLTSRHDWGPTALALALRLIFLAVWLRGEGLPQRTSGNLFILGALVGLSIYEKLSSIVLLAPLYLILSSRPSRSARAWAMAHAGLFAGALPLVIANAWTWVSGHGLISLQPNPRYPLVAWSAFAQDYFALGQGRESRLWILGSSANPLFSQLEAGLVVGLCVLVAWMAVRDRQLRPAGLCIMSYALVAIFVKILPGKVYLHHWILGTPFQYLAIALAMSGARHRSRWLHGLFATAACALLLLRVSAVLATERDLARGEAADRFARSLTQLGEFAGRHPDDLFVATTWGTAMQMYCMSDGRPKHVFEAFWDADRVETLKSMLGWKKKRTLYLTELPRAADLYPDLSAKAVQAVEESVEWREIPVDPELSDLAAVHARKFERVPP